jgi:hypothetical protein
MTTWLMLQGLHISSRSHSLGPNHNTRHNPTRSTAMMIDRRRSSADREGGETIGS